MWLLKLCVAIMACFSLSYMPLGLVSLVLRSQSKNIPSWLIYIISVNLMHGSLWNSLLYFFNQLFTKNNFVKLLKSKK